MIATVTLSRYEVGGYNLANDQLPLILSSSKINYAMENDLKKATVKSSGKTVQVYKQKSTGKWIDYSDCSTAYEESDLNFQ